MNQTQTHDAVKKLINNDKLFNLYVEKAEKNRPSYCYSTDCYLEALYLFCRDSEKSQQAVVNYKMAMKKSTTAQKFIEQASICDPDWTDIYLVGLKMLLSYLDNGGKSQINEKSKEEQNHD